MQADVIMVIGANPTDAHPVFASQMKRRLREGARLIVADPRRIDLVQTPHISADYHLALRPGTNVALINSLAHVIVGEGLVDEDFVRERCEGEAFAKWRAFVLEERNSPESMEEVTGVPAADVRAAARLYATGGNGAIYYGLGVTEHSQGSTMVMGIANLAMATGNIGREGVGVNPLRGQNNVQGSCDMGSFPHEFPGYRHVSDDATRTLFEHNWGVTLQSEPGLRIPNMFEAALDGEFKGIYIEGEDIGQSDPNTQHVTASLTAMECVVVQDLFLNETAKFAHVFLPGSTFLEKDGTFTNAERRISRVRKVMEPKGGYADWEITQLLSNAMGYPMHYAHPSEIMDEIALLTPTFHGVSFDRIDELGSIQWPCNDAHPQGTPTMHVGEFVRGKGRFMLTEYVPTTEKVNGKFPLILTTGRILSQYNVGAQTRRTDNNLWHDEDRLELHPQDAEDRGIANGDWVGIQSRAGETVMHAKISERMQPGVVYTTFHFPFSGANVITTENSDWATNCPEYKVTAVQVTRVTQPSDWQKRYRAFSERQQELLDDASVAKITATSRCRKAQSRAMSIVIAGRRRARARRGGGGDPGRVRLQRALACGHDGIAARSAGLRARLLAERGDHRRCDAIRIGRSRRGAGRHRVARGDSRAQGRIARGSRARTHRPHRLRPLRRADAGCCRTPSARRRACRRDRRSKPQVRSEPPARSPAAQYRYRCRARRCMGRSQRRRSCSCAKTSVATTRSTS